MAWRRQCVKGVTDGAHLHHPFGGLRAGLTFLQRRIFDLPQGERGLCAQQAAMAQRPFEGGLHFHFAELADGEVEVVEGFGAEGSGERCTS